MTSFDDILDATPKAHFMKERIIGWDSLKLKIELSVYKR